MASIESEVCFGKQTERRARLEEISQIGLNRPWCHPHIFSVLEPRNLDGTNLGSYWCLQRTRRFGQRGLLLPYAWKSLILCRLLGLSFLLSLADFAYM